VPETEKHSAAAPRPLIVALLVACGLLPMPSAGQQVSSAEIARMKADYRRPPPRPVENQALVDLGRLLFWDPRVSASSKTRLRELPPAGARLGGDRAAQPQRFRQAHLAKVTLAHRHRPPSGRRAERLGRAQCHARGAGAGLGRRRLDVDARDRNAR